MTVPPTNPTVTARTAKGVVAPKERTYSLPICSPTESVDGVRRAASRPDFGERRPKARLRLDGDGHPVAEHPRGRTIRFAPESGDEETMERLKAGEAVDGRIEVRRSGIFFRSNVDLEEERRTELRRRENAALDDTIERFSRAISARGDWRTAEKLAALADLGVWGVGTKSVLSGLTPSSAGNGLNRNSVVHFVTDEGIPAGASSADRVSRCATASPALSAFPRALSCRPIARPACPGRRRWPE